MDDLVKSIYLLFDNFVIKHASIPAGPEGLRSLTNPKAVIVDRWPSFIQTTIPKVLDYPLRSLKHSWFVYHESSLCGYSLIFLSLQGLFQWSHSLPVWRWLAYKYQRPHNHHWSCSQVAIVTVRISLLLQASRTIGI